MEKLEGCSDAYVDPATGITLLFSELKEVNEKDLQQLLSQYKIKVSNLRKVEKLPY